MMGIISNSFEIYIYQCVRLNDNKKSKTTMVYAFMVVLEN